MLFSQIAMDEMFDLDMALAMPDDSTSELDKRESDAESAAAARHVVDGMPTVVMGDDAHCSVCMEEFGVGGRGKQTPCGHAFHDNCISRWLSVHSSCPLCRGKVSG